MPFRRLLGIAPLAFGAAAMMCTPFKEDPSNGASLDGGSGDASSEGGRGGAGNGDSEGGGDAAVGGDSEGGRNAGDGAAVDGSTGDGGIVSVSGVCTADRHWCLYNPYPIGGNLEDIWGTSTSDLWVTGEPGTLHFDGTAWTRHFLLASRLFGTSSTDVWAIPHGYDAAVGGTTGSPNLVHWDGSQWTSISTGSLFDLAAIWGQSPTSVFAVGGAGTIMHFDGKTWTKQASGTIFGLNSLWGFAANDVWAAGDGVVLHYDGSQWSSRSNGLPSAFHTSQLWGPSPSDLWACGTGVYRWSGSSWTAVANNVAPSISGCFGRSPNDVLFLLSQGLGAAQWTGVGDGGLFLTNLPVRSGQLSAGTYFVWATGGEYVVGSDPFWGGNGLAHGSPASWTLDATGSGNWGPLIWNAGGGTYYSVGTTLEVSTTPHQWTTRGSIGVGTSTMRAIGASSPSDVWVVGDSGIATHYDGSTWTPQVLQSAALTDVWGSAPNDFWTTGGSSYHWDGQQWIAAGPGGAVVSGTAGNDVWLAGGNSASHWDGNAWATYSLDLVVAGNNIVRLNAFGRNDAWLVTSLGDVLHWNGTAWLGKANAYCTSGAEGGCGSPILDLSGSGASGFVWNASGDGWALVRLPNLPSGIGSYGMWHTTGDNFNLADVVSSVPFASPGVVFGSPGNAWARGPGPAIWKLQ